MDRYNGSHLTGRVEKEAATLGLRISVDKTKVIATGVKGQAQAVFVGGKPVEEVNEFCYLECHCWGWKL